MQPIEPSPLQQNLEMTLRQWVEYYQGKVVSRQVRYRGVLSWKNVFDLWVVQEIIHEMQPEVVIEIGCKHGGTTLWLSDVLRTLASGSVILIDLRRPPLDFPDNVHFVEGNSIAPETIDQVRGLSVGRRTMVIADGNHAADHVLAELQLYAPMVTTGQYFIVEDGIIDVIPWEKWVPGPLVAVHRFLETTDEFVVDRSREKFILTYAPTGF